MIVNLKLHKGEFKEYQKNESGEMVYRCNFLTDEDDSITLYLTETKAKQYFPLKKYDVCEVKVSFYRSDKGKYGIMGA